MVVAASLDRYEEALWAQGFVRIAGCDEAGRGALAGPLVAAAVVVPPDFDPTGIRDSKLLTAKQRQEQFDRIVAACTVAVAKAEPPVLDRRGLHRSNIMLLRRAVKALEPDYALTDGFPVPRMPCPALSIKKGDMLSASVAAASIVAKVTRDRIMVRLDRRYPAFGFSHNKGYGTREHWDALEMHGPSPVHRLSFSGVGQVSLPGLSRADVAST
jgi:ribonuclease HII